MLSAGSCRGLQVKNPCIPNTVRKQRVMTALIAGFILVFCLLCVLAKVLVLEGYFYDSDTCSRNHRAATGRAEAKRHAMAFGKGKI